MSIEMMLWFGGMWFLGSIIYSIFGLQISITKKCALKLYALLQNDTENWYAEACHKYWKKVIRKNRIILTVIAFAVVCFVPLIGVVGYFFGICLKWLTTLSAAGINSNNLKDSYQVFIQFAKPGKELEFEEDINRALENLSNNQYFKAV